MAKKIINAFTPPKDKAKYKRPEGAGNFDNMDDFNIVKAVIIDEGTIQHTPMSGKDLVNKEYVDSLIPIKLNEVENPDDNVDFNFGNNKSLTFRSVDRTPVADEGTFNFEASGNFTGDVVHIHQHTGNAGAGTNLLSIESEDNDATCLNVNANGDDEIAIRGERGSLSMSGNIVSEGQWGGLTLPPRDGTGTRFILYNPTGDKLHFYGGAILMTIDDGGNVGIGTSSPTEAKLVVNGTAVVGNHGAAATDQVVNVCYGTGEPPAAGTVTEGTLFIKYIA